MVWALGLFQLIWLLKQQGWYCPMCTLWWRLALIIFLQGKELKENSTAWERSIRYTLLLQFCFSDGAQEGVHHREGSSTVQPDAVGH